MPTAHCKYIEHHNSLAGWPPFGLLAAIVLGALAIAYWHTIVVALVIVASLAAVAGAVMLLIHNHGSGIDPELEREAARREVTAAVTATVQQELLQHRVGQLERDSVRDRLAAIETQQAARAEVERAVTQLAIAQQQRQLDAIGAAGESERQALPAGQADWFGRARPVG